MPIKTSTLLHHFDTIAPLCLAQDWDNCGLLIDAPSPTVSKIFLSLELTRDVFDEAETSGAELIVTHHPVIFRGLQKIVASTPEVAVLCRALRQGIGIYSAHTNLDIVPGGLSDYLAHLIGATIEGVLEEITVAPAHAEKLARMFDTQKIFGIGRMARLATPVSLATLCQQVKHALNLPYVIATQANDKPLQRIAILTGSGGSAVQQAARKKADVYLCGDIKYHDAVWARENGLNLIDCGHFGSEYIFADLMESLLTPLNLPLEMVKSQRCSNPFQLF
ncbi:Nif3-like dinuclear metal center hexameric protein [Chrysiogenes arsenatis]|uniref:Nif3-like dinuclear metal center hexameric protein n=1 Tax=Chrysiogenes arsenatis TaxID=309797 RepID=UPI000404C902|nr:Nif3-like dinuclear metal center hexameric protein [Chrysiogenes arsenatis]